MNSKIAVKNTWNELRFYISILFFVFYLAIAFLFLFSGIWADIVPKGRGIIGLIVFLFGSLRFYVSFHRYKNKRRLIQQMKQAKQKDTIETKQHVTTNEI